jgi:hypothetical protein
MATAASMICSRRMVPMLMRAVFMKASAQPEDYAEKDRETTILDRSV